MRKDKMEPTNPDHFYIYYGKATIDGIDGRAKVKKWIDEETGKPMEKILAFDKYESQGE
jgi:hypothetical protein